MHLALAQLCDVEESIMYFIWANGKGIWEAVSYQMRDKTPEKVGKTVSQGVKRRQSKHELSLEVEYRRKLGTCSNLSAFMDF